MKRKGREGRGESGDRGGVRVEGTRGEEMRGGEDERGERGGDEMGRR